MKFNVSGKDLQTQLQAVSKVINSKNALSILDNFLLKLEGNTLSITGGDQENVMTATMEVIDPEGEGEIAILAKRLLEVIKEINNQPLRFDIDLDTKEIKLTFNNGQFLFMGVDAAEYPRTKDREENALDFSLPGSVLVGGIEGTLFAVSTDPIRPIMTGIYFDIEPEKLTFVSSDTHKLVKYQDTTAQPGVEDTFILPAKAANVLKSLVSKEEDTVKIIHESKSATFVFGPYSLSTRLIKGVYPNYKRVFPKDNPYRLVVGREDMLNAVRRVALFASKASNLIKFAIDPMKVQMGARDLDYGTSAEESVDCDYQGDPMMIGFNSTYMIEVLSNIKGDDVQIDLADPARPGLFSPLEKQEGVEVVMLQMPMQVIE
ncbi:MAG: DNA polymerase III subunit beta [Muribaculaceae bacterium]|nr:DNA polymerase III subunit beta [Muribaculaceae bacterium]